MITAEKEVVELPLVGGYKEDGEVKPMGTDLANIYVMISQTPFLLFIVLVLVCAIAVGVKPTRELLMSFR